MKRILLPIILLCSTGLKAQNFPGYSSGNYTGVNGVFFNPASIADSRYRWDFNFFTVNATVANNYATVKTKKIIEAIQGEDLDSSVLKRKAGINAKMLGDVDYLGPSVMFNINPQSAIALTTRLRYMTNFDNIPSNLLSSLDSASGLALPANFESNKFLLSTHGWVELGLSYARVIKDNNNHFFKGGISAKFLQGIGSGYFGASDIRGTLDEDVNGTSILSNSRGTLSYGSGGVPTNFDNTDELKIDFGKNMGIGADLGFIYEYRPNYAYYQKEADSYRRDQNKYKYKIGISITDLGFIKYKTDAKSYSYTLNTALNPNGSDTMQISTRFDEINGPEDIDTKLADAAPMVTRNSNNNATLNMKMPTAVNLAFDYNINGKLYASAEAMLALNKSANSSNKTHKLNYLTITPRYEGKAFGIYLPLSVNELSGFNAGLALRAGPLTIGSGMILSALGLGETKHANVFVGLRFGGLQKNRNKEFAVANTAPEITRVDTDGDGLYDEIDACPTEAGLQALKGCPDRDGDGIADGEDECPDVAGLERYKGCPIPDTDGDGINNEEDKCPAIAGVAKYQGCPVPDRDNDGVNDEEDMCPDVAGTPANKGCPEIAKEVITKIEHAAKNVFFATGSSKLLSKSNASLNEVASLMKQDSTLRLQIDGHTDDQGDETKNQALSEARAQSVKDYLISKGVDAGRLHATGYGEANPIADNKTAAGRAQNRRTELKVSSN